MSFLNPGDGYSAIDFHRRRAMTDQIASTTPKGHAPDANPYALDKTQPHANATTNRRPRCSKAYIVIMKVRATTPNAVTYMPSSKAAPRRPAVAEVFDYHNDTSNSPRWPTGELSSLGYGSAHLVSLRRFYRRSGTPVGHAILRQRYGVLVLVQLGPVGVVQLVN